MMIAKIQKFRRLAWRYVIWIFGGLILLVILWPTYRFEFRQEEVLEAEFSRLRPGGGTWLRSSDDNRADVKFVSGHLKARVYINCCESAGLAREWESKIRGERIRLPQDLEIILKRQERASCANFRRHNLIIRVIATGISQAGKVPYASELDTFAIGFARELDRVLERKDCLSVRFDTFGNRLWEEEIKPSLPSEINSSRKEMKWAMSRFFDKFR